MAEAAPEGAAVPEAAAAPAATEAFAASVALAASAAGLGQDADDTALPSTTAPTATEPVDVPESADADDPAVPQPQPETDDAPREEAEPRARRPRRRSPRRARRAAPASVSRAPERVASSRGERRPGRTVAAALAIAALVGGTALPAIGLAQTGGAEAATSSEAGGIPAQSLTVQGEKLPDVVVRGSFSATTPAELEEIRAVAAATARSGVAPIAKPGQVIIPMAPGSYSMTDGFGASRPGRSHMGQDYAAPVGTPIYAAADGVVTMSQDSYGGYGVTVQIKHDLGGSAVSTLYGHMDYGTRAVNVGDHVVAGQFLGKVGTTGYTIGSCLHFEVRISGSPINPVPWLEANVR